MPRIASKSSDISVEDATTMEEDATTMEDEASSVRSRSSTSSRNTMSASVPGMKVPSYSARFVSNDVRKRLKHIVAPHVDSFDYFLESGIHAAIADIPSMAIKIGDSDMYIKLKYDSGSISYPLKKEDDCVDKRLTPREARERGISYVGTMTAKASVHIIKKNNDGLMVEDKVCDVPLRLGELPIMVMSSKCNLRGFSAKKLVLAKEEANEMGGYFIINGIERVIRLLQVPRRNYATSIIRSSYKNRGKTYSDKGVSMRCVRSDQTSVTITLHYLTNGGITMKFVLRKQEFLLPVIIVAKALVNISDKELFDRIIQGDVSNTYLTTRLEILLRDTKDFNIYTQSQCAAFLGAHFRMFLPIADNTSDEEAGYLLLQRYIYVHIADFAGKLECLLHMIRKLFSFVQGTSVADNVDAMMNHELLLPGHLINIYLKEKMEDCLLLLKSAIVRDCKVNKTKAVSDFCDSKYYLKLFDRFGSGMCSKIGTFLSTGNIVSTSGLDLQQVSGYTIVAERLNINRYYSHFQSVHRGQFFTTMKTTTVRKLLPESWGFLCPVHTPDGSPCGLLNHLAREAVIISFPTTEKLPTTSSGTVPYNGSRSGQKWLTGNELRQLFVSLGIVPCGTSSGNGSIILSSSNYLPVLIDGARFGGIPIKRAGDIVKQLRLLKLDGTLDPTMELAYIPYSPLGGAYPGLFIFTSPGRLVRPTVHLAGKQIEWIGPMEQVFMDIACIPEDMNEVTTHIEINPTIMLSHIASLIPFSDYNQSPRNMYQCQMGKQTMGTPAHALRHRSDNKLYRIQNPQAPIVQTQAHRDYSMDEYPQGTNAVVAVISYTGYDMEDAMIINKAAFERGFGHGSVYKTKVIDLDEEEKRLTSEAGGKPKLVFINLKTPPLSSDNDDAVSMAGEKFSEHLDYDGLPFQGEVVELDKPICCLVDTITGKHFFIKHKDDEKAYVETVRVIGSSASLSKGKVAPVRRVSITFRYRRNPVIGDKFSSRHGQKGTLSVLWPQENMPFTESGMTPDVLINPHAFPSRMTIGMLIESMAGKSGALNGIYQDSTPFQFHEEDKIIDYMGEQLLSSGYQYHGSEPLYSGLSGKAMQADIFIGVVYYQRLRHMVSDKSQVRSTGPVTALTHQPVKGRKKHGGIRLGEMERDALLSHGVSFCLHDRLMNSSDKHLAYICSKCGDLMSVYSVRPSKGSSFSSSWQTGDHQMCNICHSYQNVRPIYLPYVFRYLVNELAGMGLKIRLKLSE